MFVVTEGCHSDDMLRELLSIEKELFTKLGLHFRFVTEIGYSHLPNVWLLLSSL